MRARNVQRWSVVLLVLGLPGAARSEDVPALQPGQRLRVTATAPGLTGATAGSFVKVGPESLTLLDAEHGRTVDLPLDSITRLEVGEQHRRTKQGMLIGAAIGAVGAVSVWSSSTASCGGYDEPLRQCTDGEKVALGAATLGVWTGLGALFGHLKRAEHWSDTSMQHLKLAARPERRGARVALTLAF